MHMAFKINSGAFLLLSFQTLVRIENARPHTESLKEIQFNNVKIFMFFFAEKPFPQTTVKNDIDFINRHFLRFTI